MNGAFYIGATGLRAQERALGVVANNIANMNTPSFKRAQVRFSELMTPAALANGLGVRRGPEGGGVATGELRTLFDQGDLRTTENPMDIGVDGKGFIEVLGADGEILLWRGGTLSLREDGLLATADGLPLRALITIPEEAGELRISRDGIVTATLGGDDVMTELGRIDLAAVRDTASLEAIGNGLYRPAEARTETALTPNEDGMGALVQGAIEASNVALANEMVGLLLMQRAYAASAQAIQVGDQLMAIANGLRR